MKPPTAQRLHLVPISKRVADECVTRWHRHNAPTTVDIVRVGAATDDGVLVAVGTACLPVARAWNDGATLEVTRVACDGTVNATSMLYAALTRAGFALGYTRIITYTQADESGSSLRAAGWKSIATRPKRKGWNTVSRPRDDARYMASERTLWEAQP